MIWSISRGMASYAERLAHRWRPASGSSITKRFRRTAIRWSTGFGTPTKSEPVRGYYQRNPQRRQGCDEGIVLPCHLTCPYKWDVEIFGLDAAGRKRPDRNEPPPETSPTKAANARRDSYDADNSFRNLHRGAYAE